MGAAQSAPISPPPAPQQPPPAKNIQKGDIVPEEDAFSLPRGGAVNQAEQQGSVVKDLSSPQDLGPPISFFRDLPQELLDYVVNKFFTLPDRFVLRLTSRWMRERFWTGQVAKFDSWAFVDECAARGYVSLLRWAHSLGCPLDEMTLEAAVSANKIEAVKWLCTLMPIESFKEARLFKFARIGAFNGNMEMIDLFASSAFDNHADFKIQDLVESAADGGQVDFAIKLNLTYLNLTTIRPLLACFAKSGNIAAVRNLALEYNLNTADWNRVLHGATVGGHFEIVELAFDNGAFELDWEAFKVMDKAIKNAKILNSFIVNRIIDVTQDLKVLLQMALVRPCLEVLRWLESVGHVWRDLDLINLLEGNKALFDGHYQDNLFDDHIALSNERFECVQYLVGKNCRYTPIDLEGLGAWVTTVEQLRWVLEHAHNPRPFLTHSSWLRQIFQASLTPDIDLISYILDLKPSLGFEAIPFATCLVRNTEVFGLIHKKLRNVFSDNLAVEGINQTLGMHGSYDGIHLSDIDTRTLYGRSLNPKAFRIRWNALLDFVEWCSKNVPNVSLRRLSPIKNPYFTKELRRRGIRLFEASPNLAGRQQESVTANQFRLLQSRNNYY